MDGLIYFVYLLVELIVVAYVSGVANKGDKMTTIKECEAMLNHPNFSHTRQGDGCWRDLVWIYHFEPKSPSGVLLAGSADTKVFDAAKKSRQASPLSPTERR
jgi:hypothetical protein